MALNDLEWPCKLGQSTLAKLYCESVAVAQLELRKTSNTVMYGISVLFVIAFQFSDKFCNAVTFHSIFYETTPSNKNFSLHVLFIELSPPLPPLGHIWDVMLVWRKKNIEKILSLCYSRPIVYYYNGAQRHEQLLQVDQLYRALILIGLASSGTLNSTIPNYLYLSLP